MIRTRAGYTGGKKENPTYRALGDHAESIEIDYDPAVISYGELLEIFWKSHDPGSRPWSRQYMPAIFYHNEEQKKLAVESMKREEARTLRKIYTEISPASKFYRAEDYHQKYYLRQRPELMIELKEIYPSNEDFLNSTAAARLNGYLAVKGPYAALQAEIADLLPPGESRKLLDIIRGPDR
ncbi:MAG TPA: peptide-methionine (S)-S-oxide reductase [Deltaproteobacteria bacterium]|nr:peptide-methionine (S)-S-oxide reductase [Deltaproteobacteria bacterium]